MSPRERRAVQVVGLILIGRLDVGEPELAAAHDEREESKPGEIEARPLEIVRRHRVGVAGEVVQASGCGRSRNAALLGAIVRQKPDELIDPRVDVLQLALTAPLERELGDLGRVEDPVLARCGRELPEECDAALFFHPGKGGVPAEAFDPDGGARGGDLVKDPFHRRAKNELLPSIERRRDSTAETGDRGAGGRQEVRRRSEIDLQLARLEQHRELRGGRDEATAAIRGGGHPDRHGERIGAGGGRDHPLLPLAILEAIRGELDDGEERSLDVVRAQNGTEKRLGPVDRRDQRAR